MKNPFRFFHFRFFERAFFELIHKNVEISAFVHHPLHLLEQIECLHVHAILWRKFLNSKLNFNLPSEVFEGASKTGKLDFCGFLAPRTSKLESPV